MLDRTIRPSPFLLRQAAPSDAPLIRAWLPGTLGGTPPAMFAVATEAATGAVAGLASLRAFADGVGRFRVFVDSPMRRRGCGTALLDWVRDAARRARLALLLLGAYFPPAPGDESGRAAVAFFRARGLAVMQDILRYRAEVATALAVLEPLYQRCLRARAGVDSPRIVTADQVDPRLLAEFAVRHVGGFVEEVAARLRGQGAAYSPALSPVALVGQRVVGALLSVPQGDVGFVETRAVDPGYRNGWVNLALMYRAIAAGAPLGIKKFEFEGDSRDHDTAKLARRFGATQIGRRQCWGCQVA
jgi:GNAT superfamily N-acetyltransferase